MRQLRTALIALLLCAAVAAPLLGFTFPRKVRALHPDFADELVYVELDGQPISVDELSALTVFPDSVLRVYLLGSCGESLFYDQDNAPIPTADVTMSRLRAAGIDVSIDALQLDMVDLTATLAYSNTGWPLPSATPYMEIALHCDTTGDRSIDFALECTLSINGTPQKQTTLQIAGTVETTKQIISESASAGDTMADFRKAQIAVAD